MRRIRRSRPRRGLVLLLAWGLLVAACGGEDEVPGPGPTPLSPTVVAPLPESLGEAYAIAGSTELEPRVPRDFADLHHVFRLSERIISGSEPHGEDALKRIADMGVKTILSVDGKVPDHETAARLGMRYVHVPIRYRGITQDERLKIAKTFREMEPPFFVHCFHGKHRGPAAAAVGRVVLDKAPRDQAVAEMRQYAGTSSKYRGLYETIARGAMPAVEVTKTFAWDFPSAHDFGGFRELMIEVTRSHDHLKSVAGRAFQPDPEHPDMHARNEAAKMAELFEKAEALPDAKDKPEDYRRWLQESLDSSRALQQSLVRLQGGEDEGALQDAHAALEAIQQRCDACHKVYRNN